MTRSIEYKLKTESAQLADDYQPMKSLAFIATTKNGAREWNIHSHFGMIMMMLLAPFNFECDLN